jgi:predicted ArsR family transcriptional regulator
MRSIYEVHCQGAKTRSHLLQHISPGEELSREEIAQRSGLSYDQVRRQTRNLCEERRLTWRTTGQKGKRVYQLVETLRGF